MIHTHKLKRLSPDEKAVLIYCVNDGKDDPMEITEEALSWIKPEYAFKMLNEYAAKVEGKKREALQAISDKITNP